MSNFKRFRPNFIWVLGIVFLTGCFNSTTPQQEIYEVLETVVAKEEPFEKQQDPLVELEKNENELYNKIISLGMKEYDQIVKLSDEALAAAEKRKVHMEKEEESIQASKEEFKKVDPLIDKLEDGEMKKTAEQLYDTMMTRYKIHDEIHTNYIQGLKYDEELYKLFQKKDVSATELENQIKKVNESYKLVLEANEKFNEQTKKYNDQKVKFYQSAGIEIEETDN